MIILGISLRQGLITAAVLPSLTFSAGCLHSRPYAAVVGAPTEDSISLVYVRHLSGPTLRIGKPANLQVRLEYTLNRYKTARLSLSVEEVPNRDSCEPSARQSVKVIPVQTSSGDSIPIFRGAHSVEIPVLWHGTPGIGSDGQPIKSGAITFQVSMMTDKGKYRFLTRSFGREYCMRF